MIELFNYMTKLQISSFDWLHKTIIQCLFKEVYQCFISPKTLPYQNNAVFKYQSITDFVYAYQINTSFTRTGISLQDNLDIFKLLIMFDIQYRNEIIFVLLER